jgi:hypothetical protein
MSVDLPVSTDQTWRQSLDPKLLRRLWRPVERPGLVSPKPARALLARHQAVAAGLPLADLPHRRAGPLPDMPGAQAPIVYAQPRPPLAAGDPSSTRPAQASAAAPRPRVTAGIAQPAQAPQLAHLSPAPIARNSAAPLVVQRKADSSAAGRSAPPALAPQPPISPALPRYPALTPVAAGQSSSILAERSHAPPELGNPPTIPVARTLDTSIVDSPLPLVDPAPLAYPRTPMYAAGVAPAVAQSSAPERLVVRSAPARPAAAMALPWLAGVPAMPVVHEQIARQPMLAPNLSAAQARAPLPLVAVAHPAVSQPAVGAQSPPKPRPSPPYSPAPSAPEPAARSAAPQRSEQPAVDIDRIVDKVHRKFLRQLAIEGERRGVRK